MDARFKRGAWLLLGCAMASACAPTKKATDQANSGPDAPPDSTAPLLPALVASSPSPGATEVDPGGDIVLTFSVAMDPASLVLSAAPETAFAAASFSEDKTVATFSHGAAFAFSTAYTL